MRNEAILNYKRTLLLSCQNRGENLLQMAKTFAESKAYENHPVNNPSRIEFAVGARYLHRGYYCPSPVREEFVDNARRGRILVRPTNRSKYSHRYLFDEHSRLRKAESVLPGGALKHEYLIYERNRVLGYAFDDYGTIVGISEEHYENGRIKDYLCASCYVDLHSGVDMGITEIYYEAYHYDTIGLQDVEFYPIMWPEHLLSDDLTIACGKRYRFFREENDIVGFYLVNFDGSPRHDSQHITKLSKPRQL